jgi:hypothetical protein
MPFKLKKAQAQSAADYGVKSTANFWKVNPENGEEYFKHTTVNTTQVESDKTIWAKVDGWWQKFPIRELDENFVSWFLDAQLDFYDRLRNPDREIANGGHHSPNIATYSNRRTGRYDSMFHLNNAIKSVALVPKREYIDEYIGAYEEKLETGGGPYSIEWKEERLRDVDYWDPSILASTDLVSGQTDNMENFGFKESHYLLNTMANPVANLSYLDLWNLEDHSHWEVRGIAVNSHWNDPEPDELMEKYRKCILYPHKVQHGGPTNFIGCVFYVTELFDDSPSDKPPGWGTRVIPPVNITPYSNHLEYRVKKLAGRL